MAPLGPIRAASAANASTLAPAPPCRGPDSAASPARAQAASAVEPVIPTYLYRYRKAGQYAVATLEGGDVRAM